MNRPLAALVVLGMPILASCHRDAVSGPPAIRPGRDECAECGMGIYDERSAAALLVNREGRREYLLFDDIGCMLDSERSPGAGSAVLDRFVHDRADGAWIPASAATFLGTDGTTLRTPMGSGIGAYADHARAESGRREFGGEVIDSGSIAAWRRSRIEERRAAPGR